MPMTFEEKMRLALELYKIGEAVQLRDKGGEILLGAEIPETVDPKKVRVIDGIDAEEWKASTWPQLFEGARVGRKRNA